MLYICLTSLLVIFILWRLHQKGRQNANWRLQRPSYALVLSDCQRDDRQNASEWRIKKHDSSDAIGER